MLKGMYVFAEEKDNLEALGLVYVFEKGAYYGLPEDFDEAAESISFIREAIERGDVEYV